MWAHYVNDRIVKKQGSLPESWNNISNFHYLSELELNEFQWYRTAEVRPEINTNTHYYKFDRTELVDNVVTDFYILVERNDIVDVDTQFTRLEFRSRFTLNELVAIEATRLGNENLMVRSTLQVLNDNLMSADVIDISDERTILGIETLVSMGLLTEARGNEILGR